ncbi:MAG: trigger factor, partial [Thermoguttaceae bacterium]|nr:trigger factor [Thermoguttaceae bacterium]
KIAEQEKIEATEDDIDKEIEMIALQMGTSPRRVRLQIENAGQDDALRNQIVENKVIDLISAAAEFVEVPYELPGSLSISAINYTAGGEKPKEAEEETAEEAPAEEKAE